jgi:hypothetical protein
LVLEGNRWAKASSDCSSRPQFRGVDPPEGGEEAASS